MSLTTPTPVLRSALLAFGLCAAASVARAQTETPPSANVRYAYDTGMISNTSGAPAVVASFVAQVPGTGWMRLEFAEIRLAGDRTTGDASILRLTSAYDGAVQLLDATAAREWQNGSAYFNGDAVLVELIASPNGAANRVRLEQVVVGLAPAVEESQCGATDDRVLSTDPRAGRVLPIGCTSWLINDCNHCMLTAGHCASGIGTIEFHVPPSLANGTIQHPPPQHQYASDPSSLQTNGGQGIGNDWSYFGCFTNSTSGLSPFATQGAAYTVQPPPAFNAADPIRVTGYGVDSGVANQVNQTHVGPWAAFFGTTLQYQVDTTGGNSGSPIIHEPTGIAIGIHTHAGCSTSGTGANQGTGANHPGLQAALANPIGICSPSSCATTGTPFCAGDGSATACPCGNSGTTGHGCNNSASTGGGKLAASGNAKVSSDSLVLYATSLLPSANALFFQGDAQANGGFGNVLGDGLLCVNGTLIRLGVITASGGQAAYGQGQPGANAISLAGSIPAAGGTRHYQVYYRDNASFCAAETYNLTNGLTVVWTP
jgi:hypothetical protein